MSELHVSPATLGTIRRHLDTAAEGIEGTAGSAPRAIDGGDMTPLLTAMLSKLVDSAATMSECFTAVSARVDDSGSDFWSTAAAVSETFMGRGRVD